MAGVSDTQLSEGSRAMVKDISTSVRTGVCVCVCVCALSHTAVGAVSELSRLSTFPRVQNSLPIDVMIVLRSCPRLRVHPIPCQCLPVAYPPTHPPTAPTLARNFAAVRRVPIPDSLVTYRIASRNSTISCASDHNRGVCLNRPRCVMVHINVSHFLKRRAISTQRWPQALRLTRAASASALSNLPIPRAVRGTRAVRPIEMRAFTNAMLHRGFGPGGCEG